MARFFKLLSFRPGDRGQNFAPEYHIALPDHSIVDGQHVLTPRMTASEVDGYVDELIADLEKIRKQAKRKTATFAS